MIRGVRIIFLLLLCTTFSYGQISGQKPGLRPIDFEVAKRDLEFNTLTLDQFIAKFNGEVGISGAPVQDKEAWRISLYNLFDFDLFDLQSDTLVASFVTDLLDGDIPSTYLGFADENWYAEVEADFVFEGERRPGTLFLKMEQQEEYSWWSIVGLDLGFLYESEIAQENGVFIPSNNQDLNYSALSRYLKRDSSMATYLSLLHTETRFSQLFLFMYALQNNHLELSEVKDISFVFNTFTGWKFTVKRKLSVQRNAGWLITHLQRVSEQDSKESIPYFFID